MRRHAGTAAAMYIYIYIYIDKYICIDIYRHAGTAAADYLVKHLHKNVLSAHRAHHDVSKRPPTEESITHALIEGVRGFYLHAISYTGCAYARRRGELLYLYVILYIGCTRSSKGRAALGCAAHAHPMQSQCRRL